MFSMLGAAGGFGPSIPTPHKNWCQLQLRHELLSASCPGPGDARCIVQALSLLGAHGEQGAGGVVS